MQWRYTCPIWEITYTGPTQALLSYIILQKQCRTNQNQLVIGPRNYPVYPVIYPNSHTGSKFDDIFVAYFHAEIRGNSFSIAFMKNLKIRFWVQETQNFILGNCPIDVS